MHVSAHFGLGTRTPVLSSTSIGDSAEEAIALWTPSLSLPLRTAGTGYIDDCRVHNNATRIYIASPGRILRVDFNEVSAWLLPVRLQRPPSVQVTQPATAKQSTECVALAWRRRGPLDYAGGRSHLRHIASLQSRRIARRLQCRGTFRVPDWVCAPRCRRLLEHPTLVGST